MTPASSTLAANRMAARPGSRSRPLALWHLLSLDAPTVAVLWTWFIGRDCGMRLPLSSLAAMALAVWILYAADRLLDAHLLNASPLAEAEGLEARHHFHHRHRAAFLAGIAASSAALIPLLLRLSNETIRLYLIEGSLLVGWFLLIHIAQGAHRLPKELAVGPFFAAATFIPTVSRLPGERIHLIAPAILLAAACSLNCLFIYAWEHPTAARRIRAHATTRIGLHLLRWLPLALGCAGIVVAGWQTTHWPLDLACVQSAALLTVLNLRRRSVHPAILRAAADLALLTPLLLLPWVLR